MSTDATTPSLPTYHGKVRDVYDLGDTLLLVSSDRLSAFDVVFEDTIPNKGKILNTISAHWFSLLNNTPNHFISTQSDTFPPAFQTPVFQERSVLVHKTQRIDFECVVRAFLMGSAYKEYTATQTVADEKLPAGLTKGAKLTAPIFTPAIKNDSGHDENISFQAMREKLPQYAAALREKSLTLFQFAFQKLEKKGVYLLDTKFEFGLLNGELLLIDEIFTPDSSRFVEITEYEKAMRLGQDIPTMDKQIIRDYVESLGWNKTPPAPRLPQTIIQKTVEQYKKMEDIILSIQN
ncbi:MAG TPA: phosphoribosylaminoimidazolesuccinocarboxamide synthase [Turneriella sp.]|nr:phosphoribosylaminoimidazolesuccinocarboxamide synthase [Turneriella sp.]